MSSKWPVNLFGYHPRVPVGADAADALSRLEPAPVPMLEPAPVPVPIEPEVEATDIVAPTVTNEDEAVLVERARTNPEAFGQLYEMYVERVYSYIYHRVGNVQDAEDLTARTFYRALEKLDTYEDRGLPFSAWLFRIAHNLVANWHRDHSRRQVFSLDKLWWRSSDEARPEQTVEANAERTELWDAINRLPEERRNLLLYKLNTTLSNLEIGELMNKSESAIKSLYFRTLAALRKDLEERGWGEGASTPAQQTPPPTPHEE